MSKTPRYQVVFQGDTLPGFTPQQVQARLMLLSQRPAEHITALFSGERFCLQECLDGHRAIAYCQRLADIGAQAKMYRQQAPLSAVRYPLPLIGVKIPATTHRLSWGWVLFSLVLALILWQGLQKFSPMPTVKAPLPIAALTVPALRRYYLPDHSAAVVASAKPSPTSPAQPLHPPEMAQFQSQWHERLRADLKLLSHTAVKQRTLVLPPLPAITRITGTLPDLDLQVQNQRIQLHMPAQQRRLNLGLDQWMWQGLQGHLSADGEYWQLQLNTGDLKLAALQKGWLSASNAHVQARLQADLQPLNLHLKWPGLEMSDGGTRTLRVQDVQIQLDIQRRPPHLVPQAFLHSGALALQTAQRHLSWDSAWGVSAAQVHEQHLNYAVHLNLDELQATDLSAFALPSTLQAVQFSVFLRHIPWQTWALWQQALQHGMSGSIADLHAPLPASLPQEMRSHLSLFSHTGALEAQLSLRLQKTPDTWPQTWQAWLPFIDIALDIECDPQWLAELWQHYSGGMAFDSLPLSYLQQQGYLQTEQQQYIVHLRWQKGVLFINDIRIGGDAEYRLAQQQRQIAEAFSLLAGLQAALEDYYQTYGHFPPDLHSLGGHTQGQYTRKILLNPHRLSLQAQLRNKAQIQLDFIPQERRWQCQATGVKPAELLPATCRREG